jgi:hypothetical protein
MKIEFEITEGGNTYRDALYLADDHSFTEAEIEAMKRERFNNWLDFINTVPEEPQGE